MDQEAVNRLLSEGRDSELEKQIKKELLAYLKASSDHMHDYWTKWENYHQMYRGYRVLSKDDVNRLQEKKTPKLIVPVSYAQVQTSLAFLFSLYTQRKVFFELDAMGPEDAVGARALERDIDYQLYKNSWPLKLYCWLLDSLKYGVGIVQNSWEQEHESMRVTTKANPITSVMQKLAGAIGLGDVASPSTVEQVEKVLTFEGTKVRNISPFSFYPDPGVNMADFQEGAFVAHEEECSLGSIQSGEGSLYYGTQHIKAEMNEEAFKTRHRYRRPGNSKMNTLTPHIMRSDVGLESTKIVVRTDVTMYLNPKEWKEKTGVDLGSSADRIKFIATIVNDDKVIRLQPAGNLHGQFNYSLIEYGPDKSEFSNPGISEVVGELQESITWMFNSHVREVQDAVKNRFIANGNLIHVEDIENGKSVIRMKNAVGNNDINKAVQQLKVFDVTQGHVADIQHINKLIQMTTGIGENISGQFSPGRRSAREASNVQVGATMRQSMHGSLMWYQGIERLGRQILANTRQGRSPRVWEAIQGKKAEEAPYEQVILADPNKIAGGYDFVPFDGIHPSVKQEKGRILTELFSALISSPEVMQILNVNPSPLMRHILELYGITNLDEFNLQPLAPQLPQPQVVPDSVVAEGGSNGNQLEPVDLNGSELLRGLSNARN